MNKITAMTISAGATARAGPWHRVTAEPGVHHAAADGDDDEQESPEQLAEQAPPLVAGVPEVKRPGHGVWLAERTERDVDVLGHTDHGALMLARDSGLLPLPVSCRRAYDLAPGSISPVR